jgi:GntR family transcriptional regulator
MTGLALDAPEPLHEEVYRRLARDIASGRLFPGARLPAERAIGAALGVSRATVRRALERLAADGLVEASNGRRRVAGSTRLAEPPNVLMSFTELGAARGLAATSLVLGATIRAASLEEADRFGIAPGADLYELERVRKLDGISVALDRARVPLALAPALPETDFSTASLYDGLERAGWVVVLADYTTEARTADPHQAKHLGMAPGSPLLVAQTAGYSADGRLVELTETAYRGDRYRFRATLVRSPRRREGATR